MKSPWPSASTDQAWFWTAEWQAKEAEVDADLAAGRFTTFTNADAFLADLDDDEEQP